MTLFLWSIGASEQFLWSRRSTSATALLLLCASPLHCCSGLFILTVTSQAMLNSNIPGLRVLFFLSWECSDLYVLTPLVLWKRKFCKSAEGSRFLYNPSHCLCTWESSGRQQTAGLKAPPWTWLIPTLILPSWERSLGDSYLTVFAVITLHLIQTGQADLTVISSPGQEHR